MESKSPEVKNMALSILTAAAGAVCLIMLAALWRSRHFLRSLCFSALTGNAALLAVCWSGAFTGTALSPNLFTVGAATLLGLPGVISLLVVKLIFGV